MNTLSSAALVLAAAFLAPPAFAAASPRDPAAAAMCSSVTESSVKTLTAGALESAVQGRRLHAVRRDGNAAAGSELSDLGLPVFEFGRTLISWR